MRLSRCGSASTSRFGFLEHIACHDVQFDLMLRFSVPHRTSFGAVWSLGAISLDHIARHSAWFDLTLRLSVPHRTPLGAVWSLCGLHRTSFGVVRPHAAPLGATSHVTRSSSVSWCGLCEPHRTSFGAVWSLGAISLDHIARHSAWFDLTLRLSVPHRTSLGAVRSLGAASVDHIVCYAEQFGLSVRPLWTTSCLTFGSRLWSASRLIRSARSASHLRLRGSRTLRASV